MTPVRNGDLRCEGSGSAYRKKKTAKRSGLAVFRAVLWFLHGTKPDSPFALRSFGYLPDNKASAVAAGEVEIAPD